MEGTHAATPGGGAHAKLPGILRPPDKGRRTRRTRQSDSDRQVRREATYRQRAARRYQVSLGYTPCLPLHLVTAVPRRRHCQGVPPAFPDALDRDDAFLAPPKEHLGTDE